MLNPESVKVGMQVRYHPVTNGPGFLGVVSSQPVKLGGHTWVAHLHHMEDAYGKAVGIPGKREVKAAALSNCDPAAPGDGLLDGAPPDAVYFACDDPETLTHESPEEAIGEYLDGFCAGDCDVSKAIAETVGHAKLVVTGYRRRAIAPGDVTAAADQAIENAIERFEEEYGDPNAYGGAGDAFPDRAADTVRPVFEAAVRELYGMARIWACEPCWEKALTAEEVERIMRAYRPDWFEPAEGG